MTKRLPQPGWLVLFLVLTLWLAPDSASGQATSSAVNPEPDRWTLAPEGAIQWSVATDGRLPHDDHIEMSGRKISGVVRYGADANRQLTLSQVLYWPHASYHSRPQCTGWGPIPGLSQTYLCS